jgi:putative transposase
MKAWLTADEIADLRLPGLPETREATSRRAQREGWSEHRSLARARAGRGGGFEYHIELLPIEARLAYARQHMGGALEAGLAAMQAAPDVAPSAAKPAQVARDARLAILGAYDAFEKASDLTRMAAVSIFSRLYERGEIEAPAFVRETVRNLSARSLMRWLAARREGELSRLAVDRGAARRGKGVLDLAEDGRLKVKVLALVVRQPHLTAEHIRDFLVDLYGETVSHRGRQVAMPTTRAIQMALKAWRDEHQLELTALTDPDAFKSRFRASGSRAHLVTRLNELWEIDASPADVLTKDGRFAIYVCIDVFSRRLTIFVTKTARAEAVALLTRKAISAWGVPNRIKTDNGSDFTARATRRLFASLSIEVETAHAFSPEEKGVVERAIGTVQRGLMATLPGFIGHSVADRKVIEARRAFAARLGQSDDKAFCVDLNAEELQGYCDRWADAQYATRPHGGLGGATPYQVAAAWPHPVRRIEDQAALSLLCAPIAGSDGFRTVGKQGIRIDHTHYVCPSLLVGERVFVRLDPADMGRVFVFDEDGETFRGMAVAPELAGIDRAGLIAETRAVQRRFIEEGTAELRKEARSIKPRDVADARDRQAAKRAGKLVEFPRRADAHSTPALEAATIALRGRRAPEPRPLTADQEALMREVEADMAGAPAVPTPSNVAPLRITETPQQRFRRALEITASIEAGTEVETAQALWLGGYRETPEYRSLMAVYADFGEQALR